MTAEAIITLDLATTVVRNIGVNENGKLKAFVDCEMISDMLTLDRTKTSQFALDGRETISTITQVENEREIEFECIHVKTRDDDEERGHGYERNLVLECYSIANETRMKCGDDEIIDNV